MKICVIGGSGFIGSNLITKLKKNDYEILNLDKNKSSFFPEITCVADIMNAATLNEKLLGADYVILLAAEHRDDVKPIQKYYDVNVQGTQNVLNEMDKCGVKKIIFTSTVAVYGLNKKSPDEGYPVDPFNHYGKSKWQAEELLRAWYNKNVTDKTLIIIRPTVVFGPRNKGNVYNLLKQIAKGKFLKIGKGGNKKSMAFVDNLTSFIEYCINKKFNGLQLFNYADKPDLTTNELLQAVEQKLHKKLPSLQIPYAVGYVAGLMFDVASKITGKNFSISSVRVKKFCATTEFTANKIVQTGFKPEYDLRQAIGITVDSIQKENQ